MPSITTVSEILQQRSSQLQCFSGQKNSYSSFKIQWKSVLLCDASLYLLKQGKMLSPPDFYCPLHFSTGFFFFFFFLGSHLWHLEVPKLGVKLEGQLPAYATATATQQSWDLSCICDLYCSLWQLWALNPLNKARDQTYNVTDASQVLNLLSHNRNSCTFL